MDEFDEEGKSEGLNEKMGPLLEKSKGVLNQINAIVKKIGVVKILIVLIVIAGAYYFLTLPQPGVLNVNVLELDSGIPVNNAIVSLTSNGVSVGNPPSEITTSGSAAFISVPSNTNIQVNVDGTPAYGVVTEIENIQSGASQTITVQLPFNYHLSFTPSTESLTATPTCIISKNVSITNNDNSSSVTFNLVGDGGLAGLVNSGKFTISPGQTINVPYSIDFSKKSFSSGGSASGSVRPKGFNFGDSVSVSFVDAYSFQLNPQQITCSAGTTCTDFITIQNSGSSPITGLQTPVVNINPVSGTPTPTISVTPNPGQGNSIAPGASFTYGYIIQAPTGANALGSIKISGNCFQPNQILIKIQ